MQEKEYTWCFACGKDNPIGLKMECRGMCGLFYTQTGASKL